MRQIPPRETRAPRMHPLAVLPVFVNLAGKRVVVAGAGDAAIWKAELAAAAGAHVEVFAPDPCAELDELSQAPPAGRVAIIARRWRADDLTGAALAIGALVGEEATAFATAAREHGVPVNIVDTPELSSFSFGTIVNRSPVVIGISTDGAAPILGQAIRAKIEALLQPALGAWAAAAQRLRATIKAQLPMGPSRRDLWRQFADQALRARSAPTEQNLRDCTLAGPPQLRIGRPRRRRAGRSGAVDPQGPARPAVGRRHPLRPAGEPRDSGAGATRGAAHAGRKGRRRRLLPPRRHQPADGETGAGRQACGASQRRRPHGVRTRRRGACRLPHRRHRRGGDPGDHGGAWRCRGAADPVDRPAPHPPGAIRDGPLRGRRRSGARLAEPRRSMDHHGVLHERANLLRHAAQAHCCRARPGGAGAGHLRCDNAAHPRTPVAQCGTCRRCSSTWRCRSPASSSSATAWPTRRQTRITRLWRALSHSPRR